MHWILSAHLVLLLLTTRVSPSSSSSTTSTPLFTPSPYAAYYPPCDESHDKECRKLLTSLLHKDLQRLQFPSSCSVKNGHRFLVFQYSKETIINGFGAMFQYYATALAIAHSVNRTLIEAIPPLPSFFLNPETPLNELPTVRTLSTHYSHHIKEIYQYIQDYSLHHDAWLRAPSMACGGLKHTCYFEPSSSCTYTGTNLDTLPDLDPNGSLQKHVPVVKITDWAMYHDLSMLVTRGSLTPLWYQRIVCYQPSLNELRQRYVPKWMADEEEDQADERNDDEKNTKHQNPSASWSDTVLSCRSPLYFTAIESYLFRPKPYILSMVSDTLKLIQQNSLSIGLHIRRGDSLTLPWRSKATPADYLKYAHRIRKHIEKRFSIFNGSLTLSPELSPFAKKKPLLFIASDSISAGAWIAMNVTKDNSFVPVISPASLVYETPTDENTLYYTADGVLLSTVESEQPLPPEDTDHRRENNTLAHGDYKIDGQLSIKDLDTYTTFRNLDPLIQVRAKLLDTTTHIESYIQEVLVMDETIVHHVLQNRSKSTTMEPDTVENNYHIHNYHHKDYERFIKYILYLNDIVYNVSETERLIRNGFLPVVPADPSPYRLTDDELTIYTALSTYIYTSNAIKELTDGVIMDIYSLSHTQYFIGTCLSQVSRISSELQYNYGYNAYPPIGLDTVQCRERNHHPYAIQMKWEYDFDTWMDD